MSHARFIAILAGGSIRRRPESPSFDKQFVRDYLETVAWNKTPPAPSLPAEIIEKTSQKYQEALERLIGAELP